MDKNEYLESSICDTSIFFTPLSEAITEIKKRRENTELVKHINSYLNNDVPKHLDRDVPVLYLSRHIATPNYEALRFVELTKDLQLPVVIGQDSEAKFVTNNELKLSLGKMSITKGVSHNRDEIIENFSIIDIPQAQGKCMNQICTKFGDGLIHFHNELLREVYPNQVEVHDEAGWIDRNHRDNLLEQYKKMLALNCVHAIMFESYLPTEVTFIKEILEPAFKFIESTFGIKPLITELVPNEIEYTRNWNAYPSIFYQTVKRKLSLTSVYRID